MVKKSFSTDQNTQMQSAKLLILGDVPTGKSTLAEHRPDDEEKETPKK